MHSSGSWRTLLSVSAGEAAHLANCEFRASRLRVKVALRTSGPPLAILAACTGTQRRGCAGVLAAAVAALQPAAGAVHLDAARPPCRYHPPAIVLLPNARGLAAPKQWAGGRGIPINIIHTLSGLASSSALRLELNIMSAAEWRWLPGRQLQGGGLRGLRLNARSALQQAIVSTGGGLWFEEARWPALGFPLDFSSTHRRPPGGGITVGPPSYCCVLQLLHASKLACAHELRVFAGCDTKYGGEQNAVHRCGTAAARLACRAAGRPDALARRQPPPLTNNLHSGGGHL